MNQEDNRPVFPVNYIAAALFLAVSAIGKYRTLVANIPQIMLKC